MRKTPPQRRWFRLHIGSLIAGAATVALGFGNAWIGAVALGGLLVAVSGAAAIVGGQSVLMPRSLRGLQQRAHREARAQTERANAWMSGLLLTLLGTLVAVLGALPWLG